MESEIKDILPYPSGNLKEFEIVVKYCKKDFNLQVIEGESVGRLLQKLAICINDQKEREYVLYSKDIKYEESFCISYDLKDKEFICYIRRLLMLEICNSEILEVDGFWDMKGSDLYKLVKKRFAFQFKSQKIHKKNEVLQKRESLNHCKSHELSLDFRPSIKYIKESVSYLSEKITHAKFSQAELLGINSDLRLIISDVPNLHRVYCQIGGDILFIVKIAILGIFKRCYYVGSPTIPIDPCAEYSYSSQLIVVATVTEITEPLFVVSVFDKNHWQCVKDIPYSTFKFVLIPDDWKLDKDWRNTIQVRKICSAHGKLKSVVHIPNELNIHQLLDITTDLLTLVSEENEEKDSKLQILFSEFKSIANIELEYAQITYSTLDIDDVTLDDLNNKLSFAYQNKDFLRSLEYFLQMAAYILMNLATRVEDEDEPITMSVKFSVIENKFIQCCIYEILNNFPCSAMMVTFTLLYIRGLEGLQYPLFCKSQIKQIINLDPEVKRVLGDTFRKICDKNEQALNRYLHLDIGYKQLTKPTPQDVEREYNSLIELIPDSIIAISRHLDINGKTLLGGLIGVNISLFEKKTIQKYSELICTLRHEISHKKWIIHGAEGKFTKRSPEFSAYGIKHKEAGSYTDEAIYGGFGATEDFTRISEDLASKIINCDDLLTPEELQKIYRQDWQEEGDLQANTSCTVKAFGIQKKLKRRGLYGCRMRQINFEEDLNESDYDLD